MTRLGELQSMHTNSQDVSEEYYDLEARLVSKRTEEQRLLKHLTASTGRLARRSWGPDGPRLSGAPFHAAPRPGNV